MKWLIPNYSGTPKERALRNYILWVTLGELPMFPAAYCVGFMKGTPWEWYGVYFVFVYGAFFLVVVFLLVRKIKKLEQSNA